MDLEHTDNNLMVFVENQEPSPDLNGPAWKILIVDDEPDVHQVTLVALKNLPIEGRRLEFLHAYSAVEARIQLDSNPDLSVVLLDVVMETDDAGLQLVHYIRETMANKALRIILRTGQPGYAPELDTIRTYDINDYKTKTELTQVRLYTSLTVAIRSYWQILQLEANRRGLELIVESCTELSKPTGLSLFAEGIVTQLCALLGISEKGLVCAAAETANSVPYILAAAGSYSAWIGQSLLEIPDEQVRREIGLAITERRHRFGKTTCLFFNVPGEQLLAAYVEVNHPLSDVEQRLLEVFCSNISVAFENLQLYQRISNLAFEDPLLKLPNRNSLLAKIELRDDDCNQLALVDLDGFADINSILDQDFGDAVLAAVATRLRDGFDSMVVVARIGSDVFALLGPESEVSAGKIQEIFAVPFSVGQQHLRLSATTGFVRLEKDSRKGVELLKNAGVALKQAKSFNRGKSTIFEPVLAIAARERIEMLNRLRQAFSAERLFLNYQPFVELATQKIVGAEALLRWRTDKGEFVSPEQFIPVAEQSGLMVPIGDWIMRSALQYLKHIVSLGHVDFRMAINVSHTQFREPDFVDKLLAVIREYDVSPGNVEIELTESVAIDNVARITEKLSIIRAAGISVAIDDFGTGYSSLSILRQLHVDRLKVDRAFVSGPDSERGDFSIAETILKLAAQLNLSTIAEGLEEQWQVDKLHAMGCVEGQGYFFSRPVAADQFERLLPTAASQ